MAYNLTLNNQQYQMSLARTGGQGTKGDSVTSVTMNDDGDLIVVISNANGDVVSSTNVGGSEFITATEALYDSFDDRYLGHKASAPTVDNDGDALLTGAIYFDTTSSNLGVYNGTSWEYPVSEAQAAQTAAETAQTAAELAETNASTSETNAATSETNAATSEANALASQTASATSETNASTSETNAATSETNAATSAANASTSETNAAASELNAANSETAAANSASAAATSATDAATSESNAATSASNASTSEGNALSYANDAATSEGNASASASAAAVSEANAAASQSSAATNATNAATSATNAATSESNAATALSQVQTIYDNFDDRYLGNKSSDPVVDNDGNALVTGTFYYNTTTNELKVFSGSAWVAPSTSASNSASAAASSATAAAASATAAASSETAAASSESNAAASESAAATSESNASTSETNAATSESNAAASATAAAASYDSFDDRYLGAKASDPTLDNDGDALIDGALYFDTTNNIMKVYDLGTTSWLRTTPTSSDQTSINTVSGISSDVTTVSGISSDVSIVSGISADVTNVSANDADISTVAGISTDVNTVSTISSNVTTVAGISSDVTSVAGNSTDISTVATNIGDVNSFANKYRISASAPTTSLDSGDLWWSTTNNELRAYNTTNSVWQATAPSAADQTAINIVAGDLVYSEDLGSITDTVTTGSGNSITVVGNAIADVTTVATDISDVTTVAASITDVNAVGTNIANVNTIAPYMSDINRYATQYVISATAPSSPSPGDLWYDTVANTLKFYTGTVFASISAGISDVVSDTTPQLGGTLDAQDNDMTNVGTISGSNLQLDFGGL